MEGKGGWIIEGAKGYVGPPSQIIGGGGPGPPGPPPSSYAYAIRMKVAYKEKPLAWNSSVVKLDVYVYTDLQYS